MSKKHRDPDFEGFDDEVEVDVGKPELPEDKPALGHPSYQELAEQLTTAEKKADSYKEAALRHQAEIENIRRRNERELASAHKYSLEKIAQELLLVRDNLERGLAQFTTDEKDPVKMGVELTLKQLQDVFKKFHIQAIEPLDQPFDPAMHEAMAMKESDKKPGTVLEVLQKGYQLNDRLLRPALVVVAKG